MKKFFSVLMIAVLAMVGTQAMAQYEKGDKLLNLGVGLGAYYGGGLPLGGSFEVGITDEISVGAQADFYTWGYNYGGGYDYRYTFIPVAVRGSYHVNKLLNLGNDKVDLYGGLQLGYTIASYSGSAFSGFINNYGGGVLFGAHLGGRYYFKPKLGAFGELGYGAAALKIGITFKF
jgi:hypothetical protein